MELIYAVMSDGARTLLLRAPVSLDVQQWVQERTTSLRLLGIVSLAVDTI